jgi:hypothetical protein
MKFLCIECDTVMDFAERQLPGDGTMTAVFACPSCSREVAMLTNPMETRLVSSLGVRVGGREVPEQPMELVRSQLAAGRADAFTDDPAGDASSSGGGQTLTVGRVRWSADASNRLERVPGFVRGMVKRIYAEWAAERGIGEITPELMDRARAELGLEGM